MSDDRERLVYKVEDAIYKVLNAPGRDPGRVPYHEAAEAAVDVVVEVVERKLVDLFRPPVDEAKPSIESVGLVTGTTVHVPALLRGAFGISTSEARRSIAAGGVSVEGSTLTDLDVESKSLIGKELSLGKRRKVRVVG